MKFWRSVTRLRTRSTRAEHHRFIRIILQDRVAHVVLFSVVSQGIQPWQITIPWNL